MNEERFNDLLRTIKVMKSSDPNFSVERFVNFSELSDEQKTRLEKEFKQKKKWIDNSLYYNYVENDYW